MSSEDRDRELDDQQNSERLSFALPSSLKERLDLVARKVGIRGSRIMRNALEKEVALLEAGTPGGIEVVEERLKVKERNLKGLVEQVATMNGLTPELLLEEIVRKHIQPWIESGNQRQQDIEDLWAGLGKKRKKDGES